MSTDATPQYQHLEPRPGSNYRQWWIKGRRIRASIVWGYIHRYDEPYTPEEYAEQFEVPLEAVHEALDYTERNWDLIRREHQEEEERLRARGIPF